MEKIDFRKLCNAIIKVANKAPITYLSETSILFRGEHIAINGFTAHTRTFEFNYSTPETFIENMRTFGLMLNYSEIAKILKNYRNGNGNNYDNEK